MRFILPLALCAATTGNADINVTFSEGAPKDAFSFSATDGCLSGPVEITLDLSGSDAGLIFDVSQLGQGVEVYQPFELVSGGDLVTGVSEVADGDTSLTLNLTALPVEQPVRFTIDLDDTIGAREITVSGAEIAGASVIVTAGGIGMTGTFGSDARAVVPIADCQS